MFGQWTYRCYFHSVIIKFSLFQKITINLTNLSKYFSKTQELAVWATHWISLEYELFIKKLARTTK